MNIFAIPSWYPNDTNPIYGIFIKEQIEALARNHPSANFGVSLWGQGQESNLLWVKHHVKNLYKIVSFNKQKSSHTLIKPNLFSYYDPALIWSRKYRSGNREGIISSNKRNLRHFESQFGKPSLIHAQAVYPAGYIAQALSEQFKIPYIITARMSPFPFDEFLDTNENPKPIIKKPLDGATRIIAISHSLEKRMNILGFNQTEVIHNLADEKFFESVPVKTSNTFTFLTSGRIVEQKGIDILLKSVSTLLSTHNSVKIKIAGKGPEKQKLLKLAAALNLHEDIEWLGELTRQQTKNYINQCDCFILASRHETFGNVLTEAIACGKPIIATTCGGPEDIVNETNGLLAKVNNPEDLAQKMLQMINNYDQYDPQKIRDDFEKRFSSKVITPKIIGLYKEVIAEHQQKVSGKNRLDHL
ncbi:MAG: glycosyltransferase [Bacteroidetes bacterium]|nr:glycosyltransferase [Bacteroidota bacterium]